MNQEGIDIISIIRGREIDIQRQIEDEKIRESRYNKRYKTLGEENISPNFLRKKILERCRYGEEIRSLVKLRCGNFEDCNKYWLEDECKVCKFCNCGWDNLEHYVEECVIAKEWFNDLNETNVKDIIASLFNDVLDDKKGIILKTLWKEKEARKK